MSTNAPTKGRADLPWWLGLILVAGFISTPAAAADSRRDGGTLRLAVEADPHSLDAAQIFSNEEAMLGFLIYDTLLEANPAGGFTPVVAEAQPTTSADGLAHTFRLRRGVRFSTGRELVADDVIFSIERYFDPRAAVGMASYFRSVAGSAEFRAARTQEMAQANDRARAGERWIEPITVAGLRAPDRHTVTIRLRQPDLAFFHVLTSMAAGIVPRDQVERAGPRFATRPVGTGRFILKDWVRGARLRFLPNPHDFRATESRADAVDVMVNVPRTTQTMMFERGELDFQQYLPDPDFVRFQKRPERRSLIWTVPGSGPTFVVMNCELPPFTNRLVRQALNHAVDRQALVKMLNHRAVAARGPLPLVVSGFNINLPEYAYDPARARVLLAQAGFADGFETTLWTNRDDPRWMKIALFVQHCLTAVGVRVRLHEVSYPTLLDAGSRRKTVPMSVWDWVTISDDPKETLDTMLNGDNITDEASGNTAFYADTVVQQLFRDAAAESDARRRLDVYRSIERRVVADAPWIFLVQFNGEMLVQPWVRGFKATGFWPPARFEKVWLER